MQLYRNFILKAALLILLSTTLFLACTRKEPQTESNSIKNRPPLATDKSVTISTFEVSGGWGYDILINDTVYIHQNHVPAINGMYVFATESEAFRVADVIAEKINNNIIPPTIDQEEMQALGVTFQPVE